MHLLVVAMRGTTRLHIVHRLPLTRTNRHDWMWTTLIVMIGYTQKETQAVTAHQAK
jgi:hypothetical protein